jgi:hypothetical protein
VLKVYGESDGVGGLQNPSLVLTGDNAQTAVLNAASGDEVAMQLNYTTNKAAGNDTGLEINMTDTASPGTSNPILIKVGASTIFYVRESGSGYFLGGVESAASFTGAAFSSSWTNPGANGAFQFTNTITNTGSQTITKIAPTYNQTSGTAANTDILVNRTETAVGSGAQLLMDLQVGGVSKARVDNKGQVFSNVAEDTDSDTDDVLVTTIANTVYGLLMVRESAGTEACMYLLAGGTIEKISADATFTVTKDNASTYNVYFETNVIKVQNKVGDNKNIRLGFYGL